MDFIKNLRRGSGWRLRPKFGPTPPTTTLLAKNLAEPAKQRTIPGEIGLE
jgi:hypothetical protein